MPAGLRRVCSAVVAPVPNTHFTLQGQFSRRMATDKCFVCIFILILLLICVVVGIRIFNKKQDKKDDKDEPLQFEDSPSVASALRLLSLL